MDGGRRGRRLNPCSRKLNSELDPFYLRNPFTVKRRVVFLATSVCVCVCVCVCVLDPPKTHTRLFSAKKGNETARFGNKFNVTKRGLFCGCFFFFRGVNCWRELIKKCWLENLYIDYCKYSPEFCSSNWGAFCLVHLITWATVFAAAHPCQHWFFFFFFGFAFALMKWIILRSPKYLKLKLMNESDVLDWQVCPHTVGVNFGNSVTTSFLSSFDLTMLL